MLALIPFSSSCSLVLSSAPMTLGALPEDKPVVSEVSQPDLSTTQIMAATGALNMTAAMREEARQRAADKYDPRMRGYSAYLSDSERPMPVPETAAAAGELIERRINSRSPGSRKGDCQ